MVELYSDYTINRASITKSTVLSETEGQTTFTVSYIDDSLTNVFLNGVLLNIDKYTLSTYNSLDISNGTQIGDRIDLVEMNVS